MEGLIYGGKFAFREIDWVSLIVGSKFTFFLLCFTLYLRAIFQVQAPGALYLGGDLTEGFLRYVEGGLYMEGLIFGILRY